MLPDTQSWTVQDSIKFARLLAEHGVDLLDVSSAGNHPKQELPPKGREAFHADLSEPIKAAIGGKLLVSTVGGINNGRVAQRILDGNSADVVFVGRQFLKNPGTVWQFADDLGIRVTVAHQIEWGFFGRGVGRSKRAVKN